MGRGQVRQAEIVFFGWVSCFYSYWPTVSLLSNCYEEMALLKFLQPFVFFHLLEILQKKFMAFDLGERSTGICVGDSSMKIYPIKGRNWDGYVLSPLEQILNQISDGSGQYVANWFIPNRLFSPQVLNPSTMAVSKMREVLNQLASLHDVEFYIFGFNAYKMIWDDKEKYAFIRKQLKDLEDDGRLTTKWFTFVDESSSTKQASDFLCKKFPQLYNPQLFLDEHTLVRDRIRSHPRYQNPGNQNFSCDLAKVHKRLLDSYSACYFTREFFTHCQRNTLMTGVGIEKVQKMVAYANLIGYEDEEMAEFLQEKRPKRIRIF
ncbi:hypothetical protein Q3G72_030180 [Acer saccharum]|nr:hypothetical protein Q3G72_030180 [Acer saccharum]